MLSDGAKRTLTECADTTERDDTPTPECDLLNRAKAHAADVAVEHFPDLPIDEIVWEVSHRRQRSAGATKYDPANGEITISLAWDAFEQHGWKQFSSTVRHELIHAWQYHEFGEADHERTFDRWTDALDTTQHCERFTSPKWWLICDDCGGRIPRYRRSKTVRNPEQYSCSKCGGAIRVEGGNGH
ncbi:SprT-like domain-containing protein [Haladaptatus sp. DFWS20]|uniref:SprT family zinc-dependent metalloprotease n=1 Tax=Haladaptatus sp. DFWS20 TaxID=3403467 RepID=UPI003EC035EE